MNYADLKARIRDLVDDPAGDEFCTDAYLQNKVAQRYDDLYNDLRNTGSSFDETVVEILNVQAGTKDLSAQDAPGKPLALLIRPRVFEWKLAGTDPINYAEAKLADRLRDVQANQFIESWEWREYVIYFTPAAVAVDIRIRGEFLFTALRDDADPIVAGQNMLSCLAYMTAELIGIVKGNKAWEDSYLRLGNQAFDVVAAMLTKADLQKTRRVGRQSRRQLPRGYVNFRSS